MKQGGSKLRVLLGGVALIAIIGIFGSEVGAGPALAARSVAARNESGRPVARPEAVIMKVTPLSLATGLAAQHRWEVQTQRDAIIQWIAGVEAARLRAEAEAAAAAAVATRVESARATRTAPSNSGGGPTDGAYSDTMACIRAHESDTAGGYSAVNSSSGAGGAYQVLPSTWDGYAGYARAQDAPPETQDQWAREAISSSGTRPWAGSGC